MSVFSNESYSAWDNGEYQVFTNAYTLRRGDVVFIPVMLGISENINLAIPSFMFRGTEIASFGLEAKYKILDIDTIAIATETGIIYIRDIYTFEGIYSRGIYSYGIQGEVLPQKDVNILYCFFKPIVTIPFNKRRTLLSLSPAIYYLRSFEEKDEELIRDLRRLGVRKSEEFKGGFNIAMEHYWGKKAENLITFGARGRSEGPLLRGVSIFYARSGRFLRIMPGISYDIYSGFDLTANLWVHINLW